MITGTTNLMIESCVFSSNAAEGAGGEGGAIYARGGTLATQYFMPQRLRLISCHDDCDSATVFDATSPCIHATATMAFMPQPSLYLLADSYNLVSVRKSTFSNNIAGS